MALIASMCTLLPVSICLVGGEPPTPCRASGRSGRVVTTTLFLVLRLTYAGGAVSGLTIRPTHP
ncbi:hypothetical protein L1085_003940 [Streptomyces sp. MSC1_001]|uniref:hypothetical protein n=1 Tax=Streptomyces sp. MSC1_001 TaxID=2909263 RepID=UPI00203056C3|nr:hypothetical protein [Streptomyces sp. MSC1_001]